jgi:hypothetical protein
VARPMRCWHRPATGVAARVNRATTCAMSNRDARPACPTSRWVRARVLAIFMLITQSGAIVWTSALASEMNAIHAAPLTSITAIRPGRLCTPPSETIVHPTMTIAVETKASATLVFGPGAAGLGPARPPRASRRGRLRQRRSRGNETRGRARRPAIRRDAVDRGGI